MKNLKKVCNVLFLVVLISACTADTDENNNTASGTINLSGDDTAIIGTKLVVGNIAYGRSDLTGVAASIIIVPEGSTISEDAPILSPNDPEFVRSIINFEDDKNAFVIVVTKDLISMVIVTEGIERRYACDALFNTFITCESIILDNNINKAVFNNTTVENTDTGSILTMNGTVTW